MKDIIAVYNKKRSLLSNSIHDSFRCSKIAIIIPACNEYPEILETLESITKSIDAFYADSFCNLKNLFTVVIVINNPPDAVELVRQNNRDLYETLSHKKGSYLKICNICDIPIPTKKQGVGYARKYGMDWAVLYGAEILACMDADTLVSKNYASELHKCALESYNFALCHFEHQKVYTGVNKIDCDARQHAIDKYEYYIKEHSKLLQQTGTPYWPYCLGPTIVCSASAYASVGGMPVRKAGEDFYFVQALIKYALQTQAEVVKMLDCTVYPAARLSNRVPFGTGPVLIANKAGKEVPTVYSKTTYECVSNFLRLVHDVIYNVKTQNMTTLVERLPPKVRVFLENENFLNIWIKLKIENKSCPKKLETAFFVWFDGLKIIRLIHFIESD